MADYCDYEIHVRGTKKAALMVYATMRSADEKEIRLESGTDEEYVIHFHVYVRTCRFKSCFPHQSP